VKIRIFFYDVIIHRPSNLMRCKLQKRWYFLYITKYIAQGVSTILRICMHARNQFEYIAMLFFNTKFVPTSACIVLLHDLYICQHVL
jgi:hypothetical protein